MSYYRFLPSETNIELYKTAVRKIGIKRTNAENLFIAMRALVDEDDEGLLQLENSYLFYKELSEFLKFLEKKPVFTFKQYDEWKQKFKNEISDIFSGFTELDEVSKNKKNLTVKVQLKEEKSPNKKESPNYYKTAMINAFNLSKTPENNIQLDLSAIENKPIKNKIVKFN
jgi:hypothetical protein